LQTYKAQYDTLLERKREAERKYDEEIKSIKEKYEQEIQELDSNKQA